MVLPVWYIYSITEASIDTPDVANTMISAPPDVATPKIAAEIEIANMVIGR